MKISTSLSRRVFAPITLAAVLLVGSTAALLADTPALSFTGGGPYQVNGTGNIGWSFSLTATTQVTSLGYFDFASDGLQFDHSLGIYSSTGTLLTSATVPAGAGATLLNGFRYVSISALTLSPGTYVVDATVQAFSDYFYTGATTITTVPGIKYLGTRSSGGAGLVFPTGDQFSNPNGDFGPNFQVAPAAVSTVPDTGSTVLLLGLGLSALLAAHRVFSGRYPMSSQTATA